MEGMVRSEFAAFRHITRASPVETESWRLRGDSQQQRKQQCQSGWPCTITIARLNPYLSTSADRVLTTIFLSKGLANSVILEMRKLCVSACEQFAPAGDAGSKPRMRTVVPDHQRTVSYADCVPIDVCPPNLCLCRPISIFLGDFCLSMFKLLNYPKRHPKRCPFPRSQGPAAWQKLRNLPIPCYRMLLYL